MQGPTAATDTPRRAPRDSIARDRGLDHPAERARQPAWPAATTRASRIGQQHRGAVGGERAADQPGVAVTTAVGLRRRGPGASATSARWRNGSGGGEQGLGGAEAGGRAAAVLGHGAGIVVGAAADVEAGVEALGDPALAGEEAVADARQAGQQRRSRTGRAAHAPARSRAATAGRVDARRP